MYLYYINVKILRHEISSSRDRDGFKIIEFTPFRILEVTRCLISLV